jgi:hypothetical protein
MYHIPPNNRIKTINNEIEILHTPVSSKVNLISQWHIKKKKKKKKKKPEKSILKLLHRDHDKQLLTCIHKLSARARTKEKKKKKKKHACLSDEAIAGSNNKTNRILDWECWAHLHANVSTRQLMFVVWACASTWTWILLFLRVLSYITALYTLGIAPEQGKTNTRLATINLKTCYIIHQNVISFDYIISTGI